MTTIDFDTDFAVPTQVKYTRRRGSIGLRVDARGISIFAPENTPDTVINELLQERRQWLTQALQAQAEHSQQRPPRTFKTGNSIPYLGQPLPLSIIFNDTEIVELDSGQLCIDLVPGSYGDQLTDAGAQQRCQALLADWLQQQAEDFLPQRLALWSQHMALDPSALKIRHYRSRWGSCDQHGRITFNNRLMMAPQSIIDYVVIHELSHLVHLNHSQRFWQLVARYCPDHRQKRRWLKHNTQALRLDIDQPLTPLP